MKIGGEKDCRFITLSKSKSGSHRKTERHDKRIAWNTVQYC